MSRLAADLADLPTPVAYGLAGDNLLSNAVKFTTDGGMEHLFKPFSQIDSGLARKFEGTGLGLATVKLLAELHGGAVAVESAVGHGSCITVWLPWRTMDETALALASPLASVAALSGPRTALVVEDVKGFDVVDALNEQPDTARIRVIVVTAKQLDAADRVKLHGYVTRIMEKTDL